MESRTKRFIITIVILGVIGGLGALWVNLFPDFLWFEMVDYKPVFTKILWNKNPRRRNRRGLLLNDSIG